MHRPSSRAATAAAPMQPAQAGPAGVARADGRGRRAHHRARRRAGGGDRRHRRHLSAHARLPAVLFDDIPGYPSGYRVLANILTSVPRINLTLGMPADGDRNGPRALLAQVHEGGQDHSAGQGRRRARCMENVASGNDMDLLQDPDAEMARARRRPLHRHRLHGDHEGSAIPAGSTTAPIASRPRPQHGLGHDLEGQARQPDHAPLSRARRAVPDRRRGRHASRRCSWSPGSRSPTARTNMTRPAA